MEIWENELVVLALLLCRLALVMELDVKATVKQTYPIVEDAPMLVQAIMFLLPLVLEVSVQELVKPTLTIATTIN